MAARRYAKFFRVSRTASVTDLDTERRWRAVLDRDRRYDGRFVYAVRSTGIYCRPSCASRKPRRRQVAFFAAPDAAERAGFRPCRRCQPTEAAAADPRIPLVREVCQLIDARPDEPASLTALSRRARTTPHRLVRAFRAVLGLTPRQYRDERRLARFKTQLKQRKRVSPALYEAGYGSSSRVYERAHEHLGMTPATYGRGGPGAHITFAVAPCALGRLLVAGTDRGVCRIALGDDPAALERELRIEFPGAVIARDDAMLRSWVAEVVAHLDGRQAHLDLPLDIRATAFQRRVWEALRKIPYGSTRSYSQIARAVGNTKATRAVARACASNPVAVVIPCHRVVREDGDLGGYRWGEERKIALLEQERGRR